MSHNPTVYNNPIYVNLSCLLFVIEEVEDYYEFFKYGAQIEHVPDNLHHSVAYNFT